METSARERIFRKAWEDAEAQYHSSLRDLGRYSMFLLAIPAESYPVGIYGREFVEQAQRHRTNANTMWRAYRSTW